MGAKNDTTDPDRHRDCWWILRGHGEPHEKHCGDADCPALIPHRRREAALEGRWLELKLVVGDHVGGKRHFLGADPIHCGALIELQATDTKSDDYGEYTVVLQRGVIVRYEASLSRPEPIVTLYADVGGHTFTSDHHAGMRFRIPRRKD